MMITIKFNGKIVDNEFDEKSWSNYQRFLIEKLGLRDNRSNSEKNRKIKETFDANSIPFLDEFLKKNIDRNVDEPDSDDIEKQNKKYEEKLLLYFTLLIKVNIHNIKLSLEETNTLKKFLLDFYLSVSDIEKILKNTDYESKHKNIDKKKKKFLNLGLIEKVTKPSGKAYVAKLDRRKIYYKLTPGGLFYVLKEIQREDIGDKFFKPDFESRVFEIYKDDPLLEIFLNHDLIDMTVMREIKSYAVRWIFTDYLKNICHQINKELWFFADFQKNGVRSGAEVKWYRNLNKMNQTRRRGFIDRLLYNVILVPYVDKDGLKPSDFVTDLNISDKICSFSFDNRKYSIEIEETGTYNNKIINAKYCINDEENIILYDPDIGKQYTVKYNEIAVEKRKHCFVLKRINRDPEEYINSSISRFIKPIQLLRTQLAHSILQLFPDTYAVSLVGPLTDDYTEHITEENSELAILASDSKIRRLVTDDFYKEINKKYRTFLKFTK